MRFFFFFFGAWSEEDTDETLSSSMSTEREGESLDSSAEFAHARFLPCGYCDCVASGKWDLIMLFAGLHRSCADSFRFGEA